MKSKLSLSLILLLGFAMLSVLPVQAHSGYTAIAYQAKTVPTIDGKWTTPEEWTDAFEYRMVVRLGPQQNHTAVFRIKHDAENIYAIIELLTKDKVNVRAPDQGASDRISVNIDPSHSGSKLRDGGHIAAILRWVNDTSSDYWLQGWTGIIEVGNGWEDVTRYPQGFQGSASLSSSPLYQYGHQIYELRIPKKYLREGTPIQLYDFGGKDVVGILVTVYDEDTGTDLAYPPLAGQQLRARPDRWANLAFDRGERKERPVLTGIPIGSAAINGVDSSAWDSALEIPLEWARGTTKTKSYVRLMFNSSYLFAAMYDPDFAISSELDVPKWSAASIGLDTTLESRLPNRNVYIFFLQWHIPPNYEAFVYRGKLDGSWDTRAQDVPGFIGISKVTTSRYSTSKHLLYQFAIPTSYIPEGTLQVGILIFTRIGPTTAPVSVNSVPPVGRRDDLNSWGLLDFPVPIPEFQQIYLGILVALCVFAIRIPLATLSKRTQIHFFCFISEQLFLKTINKKLISTSSAVSFSSTISSTFSSSSSSTSSRRAPNRNSNSSTISTRTTSATTSDARLISTISSSTTYTRLTTSRIGSTNINRRLIRKTSTNKKGVATGQTVLSYAIFCKNGMLNSRSGCVLHLVHISAPDIPL